MSSINASRLQPLSMIASSCISCAQLQRAMLHRVLHQLRTAGEGRVGFARSAAPMLHAARCVLSAACCMLQIACCLLHPRVDPQMSPSYAAPHPPPPPRAAARSRASGAGARPTASPTARAAAPRHVRAVPPALHAGCSMTRTPRRRVSTRLRRRQEPRRVATLAHALHRNVAAVHAKAPRRAADCSQRTGFAAKFDRIRCVRVCAQEVRNMQHATHNTRQCEHPAEVAVRT